MPKNKTLYFFNSSKEIIINSTFLGGRPTWANACVGNNGSQGYIEYSKGFSIAAITLLEKVISSKGLYSIDDLIYPICFNFRHSVELRLKGAIEEIIKISVIKNTKIEFDLKSSHDIRNIWSFFRDQSEKLDSRYVYINKKLQGIIIDISNIDSNGQTFRYPFDRKSKKHLTDIGGLINCGVLYLKFKKLERDLDLLHFLNTYLVEEYEQGTFTKGLSRPDLFKIGAELPMRDTWKDSSFSLVKSKVRSTYRLSSNEFSKALNIIQDNYEIAPLINVRMHTLGISEEQICALIGYWIRLHPNFKDQEPKSYSFSELNKDYLDGKMETVIIMRDIVEELKLQLDTEYLAGIKSLYYFSNHLDFSEAYINYYRFELDRLMLQEKNLDDIAESVLRMMGKTNFLKSFLESLYFLKLSPLAERLVSTYELEGVFDDLDSLRSRDRFKKDIICGY